jgi:mannose/cellobiose epimerase-like protein (N-acyl-D-glucosamine 2-epimerase family)
MHPDRPTTAVRAASDSALAWLRDTTWPFWLARGIDRTEGREAVGFHEYLSLDDHRCTAEFRRLRVVTRQIYVFSEALGTGLMEAEEAVALGLGYLRRHAFDPDGGYHWRFDLRGGVIDLRRDLYDHAFVLLALSTAMRVRPDPVLRAEALALDTYLHDVFPHPEGGYGESLPPSLPRRQNPHMHLLEACLAAAEVFGNTPFLDRADDLVDLFFTRMLQPADGALPEYFDDALVPHRENGRFLVEPGHHSEWVWLLDRYARRRTAAGRPALPALQDAIAMLNRFTDRYGIHSETGALIDVLWSDGTIASAAQRLWPQTERLKAEILRPDADEGRILKAYAVLESYITPAPAGLWMEQRLANGRFSPSPAPASSLYHLTSAFTESARIFGSNLI